MTAMELGECLRRLGSSQFVSGVRKPASLPLSANSDGADLTLSVLAGVVCLVWFELLKYFDCLKLEPS